MSIDTILQILMIGSGILMIVAILLQQRGATLGAGFGSSGELYTTRRGVDKNLFEAKINFILFLFPFEILKKFKRIQTPFFLFSFFLCLFDSKFFSLSKSSSWILKIS